MKKIMLALALLASVQVANAQYESVGKSPKEAKAAFNSAEEATKDAKQSTKAATWIKFGSTCLDAYDVQVVKAWPGASKDEVRLYMNEEPSAVEDFSVAGTAGQKATYKDAVIYFDSDNKVRVIVPVKPVADRPLFKALDAFSKAYQLDDKKKKTKDITNGITGVHDRSVNYAYDLYQIGELEDCYKYFKLAYDASVTEPCNTADTSSLYNAGSIAVASQNYDVATELYKICIDKYGYYGEDGEIFVKMAAMSDKKGDKENARKILEEGFIKFPESQGILLGLINYYIENHEDTGKIFTMLDQAKQNEPNNASLYYVEGNIKKELGDMEGAIAAYNKSTEVNPNFEYGYIGIGQTYYDKAIEIQEAAQTEMDDAKYMALVKEFESSLKECIGYFEKGFEVTKNDKVKVGICEYIKNASFRFRDDEQYKNIYEKYNTYYEEHK